MNKLETALRAWAAKGISEDELVTFASIFELQPQIDAYKEAIAACADPVGQFVNDNVMLTNAVRCFEDRDKARAIANIWLWLLLVPDVAFALCLGGGVWSEFAFMVNFLGGSLNDTDVKRAKQIASKTGGEAILALLGSDVSGLTDAGAPGLPHVGITERLPSSAAGVPRFTSSCRRLWLPCRPSRGRRSALGP